MQDYLDHEDLFVYLRMLRSSDSRLFLVVEGQSDIRALERHMNSSDCTIVAGYGKRKVLTAMRKLQEEDPDGCVGLVDRDFGKFAQEVIPENVVTTTLYDRESDFLLFAGLIDDFIAASIHHETARKLISASESETIRDIIVKIAYTIGRIRWAVVSNRIRLTLYKFPVSSVIAWPAVVNEEDVIDMAIRNTDDCETSSVQVLEMCSEPLDVTRDEMCNGHDLIASLSASSRWWANREIRRIEIERFLSGAIRIDILEQLAWFGSLDRWARERGRRIWMEAA